MPEARVDLICLGEPGIPWPLGTVWSCQPTPESVGQALQSALKESTAEAFLFWDVRLGAIPVDEVLFLLSCPDDLWHAGLCLGMQGQPQIDRFYDRPNLDAQPGSGDHSCHVLACLLTGLPGAD